MLLLSRRLALAAAGLALARPALVQAQAPAPWPNRPVRVIIPWPPGGGADTVGRILFARVGDLLGQPFVIENRPGAAGSIGAAAAAQAAPDGYTILHDATPLAVNPWLYPRLSFDVERDFAFVFLATLVPNLLVVSKSVTQRTVPEVIALAKATPGGLDWASSGNGSAQHLALAMFAHAAGIQLNHVPYRGGGPALNDVIGGQIGFFFSNASASTPHVKAGTLRAIAHTGSGRLATFPDLPAVAETLPEVVCYEWNGVLAPAGTPPEIVQKLNATLVQVVGEPAIAARLADLSIETRPGPPADFAAFYRAEKAKWGKVVKEADIRVD